MSTIVRYEGNGTQTQFPYSFPNFNEEYNTLGSRVVDLNNGEVAGYVITLNEGVATSTPAIAENQFIEIFIELEETPVTEFNRSTHRITEDNLNDSIYQNLTTAQAALDGRSANRQVPLDLNGKRAINAAPGVEDTDLVTMQQLSDGIGNIDALVQRAETAADESETARDESVTAKEASEQAAADANTSAVEAAESAEIANTMFKGEWEPDYPNGLDTGYDVGDTVLYENNQYKSLINNNTSVPTSTLGTEWIFFLPGAISSEQQAASFFHTYFQADGVETGFDLTALNPTWTPKVDDNIFLVLINGETSLDWTIEVDIDGHSILRFLTPPPESNDTNKNNIFVAGGSPLITDIPKEPDTYLFVDNTGTIVNRPDDITLPINDEIYYGGARELYTPYNEPEYNSVDESYTLNGINQLFVSNGFNLGGVDEFSFVTKINCTAYGLTFIGSDDSKVSFQIELQTGGNLRLYMSSDGINLDIANNLLGADTLALNTDYYLRVTKTLTNYIIETSLDNSSWTEQYNIVNSNQLYAGANLVIGGRIYTGSTQFFNGKVFLSETSITKDGIEVLANETESQAYILNTVVWKGSTRSDDNTENLITNDNIRSTQIRNQYYEFVDDGRKPAYDPETLSCSNDGSEGVLFLRNDDFLVDTDDLDMRNRMDFNRVDVTQPIFSNGAQSPIQSFVFKTDPSNQLMYTYLSSNGTSWDIASGLTGSKQYQAGVTYDFRFMKTPTGYVFQYSEDLGQTWIDDIVITTSLYVFNPAPTMANIIWGGDYSPNPDVWYNGVQYLEGVSLYSNGKYVIAPQDPATATIPYTDLYYFVGYDNSMVLKLEFTKNADGTGLPTITGAKRRLGDNKNISFPTDSNGNLAYFQRKDETWEFELWSGLITSGSLNLNNSLKNYTNVVCYGYNGSNTVSKISTTHLTSQLDINDRIYVDLTNNQYIYYNIDSFNVFTVVSRVSFTGTKVMGVK